MDADKKARKAVDREESNDNQELHGRNKGKTLSREPGVTGSELVDALKDRVSITAGARGGVGVAGSLSASVNSNKLSDTGSITVSPGGGEGIGLSGSLAVDLRILNFGPAVQGPIVNVFEVCGGG